MTKKEKSPRNRTLKIDSNEIEILKKSFIFPKDICEKNIRNSLIHGNLFEALDYLPDNFADLIIIDPPYNIDKDFHGWKFYPIKNEDYFYYLKSWFPKVCRKLKANGSLYMCSDWKSTSVMQEIISSELTILNRITWQREKGRGSTKNWKNTSEDIWFAVKNTKNYCFNIENVKVRKKVIAPYKEKGKPKDWETTELGNYRMTYPSNFWDDITIPFWSMPENTPHPTQKSEKLYAKLILASSNPGDLIFDPFLGSGTSSVVAKKLNRQYCGVEFNEEYCLYAAKRLEIAKTNTRIQGFENGIFWERNSLNIKK